jgi:hypothetical protein
MDRYRRTHCMASMLTGFESCGFLPVETLKSLVYAAPVDNKEALHHRIVDACQTIHNYPGILERMRRSMMRHVEVCTESRGGHFEHLFYKCTLSAVTHKLNVFGHMLIQTFFLVLLCETHAQSLSAPFSHILYVTFSF